MSHIDWPRVKADYVEGIVDARGERQWPSLREVARLHQIDDSQVRLNSAREDWTGQRGVFQARAERDRQTKRIAKLTADAIELDGGALDVARAGLRLVQHRVGEVTRRAAEAAQAGSRPSQIDAHEQVALANAAAKWHALGQTALGAIPTQPVDLAHVDLEPLDVELQRLVREVREAEAAEQAAPSPNGHN